MKRIFSWVVTVVLEYILMILVAFASALAVRAFHSIGQLSEGLFWAVVILGGSTVLGAFIWLIGLGNALVVGAAEKICPSKKGVRYIVIGTLFIALYGFLTWATYIGATQGISMVSEIACIINAIAFLVVAHTANAEK